MADPARKLLTATPTNGKEVSAGWKMADPARGMRIECAGASRASRGLVRRAPLLGP